MFLRDRLAKARYSKEKSRFRGQDAKEVFTGIYQQNYWGNEETVSGPGSDLGKMSGIATGIERLLGNRNIRSLLDLPCGDFHWMQHLDLSGIQYTGADIVADLIRTTATNFEAPGRKFKVLDIIEEVPKAYDLVLNRDCFVHFSFENIFKALQNLKASGSEFLLTTSFTRHGLNYDITTGDWRPINLEKAPFHLPRPLEIIPEYYEPGFEKEFKGKALCLWKIQDLP